MYCAYRKQSGKGVKRGMLEVAVNGADGRRNGIEIVVRKKLVESVLKVRRVSDRNCHETGGKKVDIRHNKRV